MSSQNGVTDIEFIHQPERAENEKQNKTDEIQKKCFCSDIVYQEAPGSDS